MCVLERANTMRNETWTDMNYFVMHVLLGLLSYMLGGVMWDNSAEMKVIIMIKLNKDISWCNYFQWVQQIRCRRFFNQKSDAIPGAVEKKASLLLQFTWKTCKFAWYDTNNDFYLSFQVVYTRMKTLRSSASQQHFFESNRSGPFTWEPVGRNIRRNKSHQKAIPS